MAATSKQQKQYEKFEDDVRVTISPKSYTWPDGNTTTYVPCAIIGKDEFVELICRNMTATIVAKASVDVGRTMHVKGVVLKSTTKSGNKKIGADRLSDITPRKPRVDTDTTSD